MKRFLLDESGAVTIDWVVVAASLTGIAIAMTVVISDGFETGANTISQGISYNDIPDDMLVLLAAASTEKEAAIADGSYTPFGGNSNTEVAIVEYPADPVSDPANDPVSDPVTDPVSDPVTDPVSDPVTDQDTGGWGGWGGWSWW